MPQIIRGRFFITSASRLSEKAFSNELMASSSATPCPVLVSLRLRKRMDAIESSMSFDCWVRVLTLGLPLPSRCAAGDCSQLDRLSRLGVLLALSYASLSVFSWIFRPCFCSVCVRWSVGRFSQGGVKIQLIVATPTATATCRI